MLSITIIAVGKLKERFWSDACAEYLKRLQAYAQVTVKELSDIDPAKAGGEQAAVQKEGEAIAAALDGLPKGTQVVLMAIKGKQLSSEEISQTIDRWTVEGISSIAFIIGGSCGVSDQIVQRAAQGWSFGKITLPHNLARVVLLEQLYRAFKISRGEPYHK